MSRVQCHICSELVSRVRPINKSELDRRVQYSSSSQPYQMLSVQAESSMAIPVQKAEGIISKVVNFFCTEPCRRCCDCCLGNEKKKLTKADIQHTHIPQHDEPHELPHEPVSRAESNASSYSAVFSPGYRERLDSGRSTRTPSSSSDTDGVKRTGSTSSYSDRKRNSSTSSATPIIDMKPIEFWAANRETVQPRTPRRRMPSESEFSIEDFKPDLYENNSESEECLTDEQKLARFKLGQVHFSIHYEFHTNHLIVKLIEARELPRPVSQDTSKQDMAHSNPYAKVCLLPDQKNSRQSAVQRKTQNPTWGEIFAFEVPFAEAQRRTLEVTVKDFDKYSRHCVIGQVHIPLANCNLAKPAHTWKPLMPSTKENPDLGEILLSLNYLPSAGRLNVDVIKAKQLLQTDLIGGSDPLVKVTMCVEEKPIKSKKTSTKKGTIDPVFNESFAFNVTMEQLQEATLVVTVWNHNSKSKDDFVGRILMGRQSTGPYEVTHWNKMLQCQRSSVAQWHTLRTRDESDHACPLSVSIS